MMEMWYTCTTECGPPITSLEVKISKKNIKMVDISSKTYVDYWNDDPTGITISNDGRHVKITLTYAGNRPRLCGGLADELYPNLPWWVPPAYYELTSTYCMSNHDPNTQTKLKIDEKKVTVTCHHIFVYKGFTTPCAATNFNGGFILLTTQFAKDENDKESDNKLFNKLSKIQDIFESYTTTEAKELKSMKSLFGSVGNDFLVFDASVQITEISLPDYCIATNTYAVATKIKEISKNNNEDFKKIKKLSDINEEKIKPEVRYLKYKKD